MESKKQTAVEFLADRLYEFLHPDCYKQIHEIFQQALQIEQGQMAPEPSPALDKIEVLVDRCSIIESGSEFFLPKKMVYLAAYLKENSGKFVSRESILDNVWPGVCVEERTVDVHIRKLREMFPNIPIRTHKGIGYGWIEDN